MRICISSSIANFEDKLLKRTKLKPWTPLCVFEPTVFFGCYHAGDYLKLIFHRGRKTVFWCGSDILNLKHTLWRHVITKLRIRHICENSVEDDQLARMGIDAQIHPMIFDTFKEGIHFKPSKRPQVYLTCHPGLKSRRVYNIDTLERIAPHVPDVTFHVYGVEDEGNRKIENIVYHGYVRNEVFNEDIKQYQGALRLNAFDGFSEILAKSALMGQYPISMIYYPHITHVPSEKDVIEKLQALKDKTKPNYTGAAYWSDRLTKSLCHIQT